MKKEKIESGASIFQRSANLIDIDPLEEIFELNLGDFITEHLISDELASKIAKHDKKDKIQSLKTQLKELISIYSIDNTLNVLGLENKEDYIIYNSIAKTISKMIDVDSCHIYLAKENTHNTKDSKDIILVGSSSDRPEKSIYDLNIGFNLDDNNPIVKSFTEQKSLIFNNIENDSEYKVIEIQENNIKMAAFIPMHNNLESVGVIVIERKNAEEFENDFLNLVKVIGILFATSMYLQKLINETKKMIDDTNATVIELQHLRAQLTALIGDLGVEQQSFVESLAQSVNLKSNYNINHSQEVANLSKKICIHLGLNEKTTDLIYYAGLLQNIGKIILPKNLFAKNGKLSKEEWEYLQNHSNVGVNLLMNINFLSEVIPYIHYNKERWDGLGKPEGLAGNNIPLGSRIIAIADAYCALTSSRPHREALSKEEALKIMKQEANTKWDPLLVDTLCFIQLTCN